jgi:uncharacterized protein
VGRESAFEKPAVRPTEQPEQQKQSGQAGWLERPEQRKPRKQSGQPGWLERPQEARAEEWPSLVEQVVGSCVFKSSARSVGTQTGLENTRSLFGGARRRR